MRAQSGLHVAFSSLQLFYSFLLYLEGDNYATQPIEADAYDWERRSGRG